MSFWNWGRGDTKKDESEKKIDYKAKYKRIKKEYKELFDECKSVAASTQAILNEEAAMKFVVFATTFQCGGKLELSKDTIKLAREAQQDYELDFSHNEKDGSFTTTLKRKEDNS